MKIHLRPIGRSPGLLLWLRTRRSVNPEFSLGFYVSCCVAGNATLRPVLHSWGYLNRDYLHLLIPWVDRGMVQGQLLHLEHECLPRLVLFPLSMEAEGHESAFGLPWTLVDGWIPVSVTLLFSLGSLLYVPFSK